MNPSRFIDLLFPRRCPVCNDIVMPKGGLICPECVRKLSFVKNPVCKKCGKEVISNDIQYCFDCTRHQRTYEYGRALINYEEKARSSMAKIKYKNKREYLDFYAEAICKRYQKLIDRMEADVLVPVPIHPTRMRRRGFNQSKLLAERIGKRIGIPVCPQMLLRNRKTMPQKGLDPAGRLKNLEEAFTGGYIPEGVKGVILVDDIYTTGSTIEACSRVLRKAGIKKVYFLSICIGRGQ